MTDDVVDLDELSDRIWGADNWVICEQCPDGEGNPSRHHIRFHDRSGTGGRDE